MTEPNFPSKAEFIHCLIDIFEDGRSIRYRFGLSPGLKIETQRMHITVGPYARITEKIPGTANGIAGLQDGKRLTGTVLPQMDCLADA